DIDCGGSCSPCEDDENCVLASDCLSGVCHKGVCTAASCRDKVLNQDETDIDCGGSCRQCGEGMGCVSDSDCLSDYCHENTCRMPTCRDGVLNQDETDIDCGGSCRQCGEGMGCVSDSDCLSDYCHENTCMIPTCSDGIQNQGEEDIDCGGPCKSCTPVGIVGYIIAFSGSLGGLLTLFIILLSSAFLFFYTRRGKKYVAAADYLKEIKSDELEDFINKRNPHIVAGTSRKLRRLKNFIDEGLVNIVWIQDWDFVNELVSKGLDDNTAESIALAKQLKAELFVKDPEAKRIAEEVSVKVYDEV
ncbi:MAG: hypothetical protein U9Q22_00265, partial [Candidatus Altiarchaeota archaeon]|nr:hypothetical protein [Candidatus Altiarchaeota archaeon]